MGRGLSQQQRKILGIAYHANRFMGGEPPIGQNGMIDVNWQLAANLVHDIPFTEYRKFVYRPDGGVLFASGIISVIDLKSKSAKTSTIRAITGLYRGGYLNQAPGNRENYVRESYALTEKGWSIGKDNEIEFPQWKYFRAGLVYRPRSSVEKELYALTDYLKESGTPILQALDGLANAPGAGLKKQMANYLLLARKDTDAIHEVIEFLGEQIQHAREKQHGGGAWAHLYASVGNMHQKELAQWQTILEQQA